VLANFIRKMGSTEGLTETPCRVPPDGNSGYCNGKYLFWVLCRKKSLGESLGGG
jgi:hypothetical protein